jgi:hypothetical protein
LCGVYGIINAVRWACRDLYRFSHAECEEMFAALTRELDHRVKRSLTDGIGTPRVFKLAQAACEYMRTDYDITVAVDRPLRHRKDVSTEMLIEELSRLTAHPHTGVLIGICGDLDHWTVCRAVTEHSLLLFDSSAITRVTRRMVVRPACVGSS